MIDDKQLIAKLLSSSAIDHDVLREGLELADENNTTLYDTLLDHELIDEQHVIGVASEILNVPSVNLQSESIDPEAAQLISGELARGSQSIPLELIEDDGGVVMRLAMADPIDVMAMDEIASHTGIDIRPVLAGPADLSRAIADFYGGDDEIIDIDDDEAIELIELDDGDDMELVELDDGDEVELVELDDDEDGPPPALGDHGFDDESEHAEGLDEEDSWAAMFEASEGTDDSLENEDSAVISQEMRDRPPTGVFEVDEEDDEEDESNSPIDFEIPDGANNDGTQLGSPGDLGGWELDDALESSDFGDSLQDDQALFDESEDLQYGDPTDLGDWSGGPGKEIAEEEPDESPAAIEKSNKTQLGVATRGGLAELGLNVDEAAPGDEAAPIDDGDPSGGDPDGEAEGGDSGAPPSGIDQEDDAADVEPDKGESDTSEAPSEDSADDDDNPLSSIRSALAKASARRKEARKRQDTPKVEAISMSALDPANDINDKKEQSTGVQRERQESSPLGRIEVKQVEVSPFQGAVERRSDLESETVASDRPVTTDDDEDDPSTREMSPSDLFTLAQDDDQSPPLNWPEEMNAHVVLRGLVALLVEREVITTADVQSMIDTLKDD